MLTKPIEVRVSELEEKMAQLISEKSESEKPLPWWERRLGAFKNSPDYDSAMRRCEEYRKAQPNAAENPEAVIVLSPG